MLFACWCLLAGAALVVGGRHPRILTWGRVDRLAVRAASWVVRRAGRGSAAPDPVSLCAGLIAELRAGSSPQRALIVVTEGVGLIPRARAAALLGASVVDALAADAASAPPSAAPVIRALSACWQVSAESGAGLAEGLERVSHMAIAAQRVEQELAAETAGPRATARVLSFLPLFGLILGELMGARPLQWLTTTPLGLACLSLGGACLAAGWSWSRWIIRSALPDLGRGG